MTALATDPAHWRFWPAGVPKANPAVSETLPMRLAQASAEVPDKTAIVFGDARLSYAELWLTIERLAAVLHHRLQVQAGDRVLLMGQNSLRWVIACQAILRAGAVVVPINAMCKPGEVAFHASDSGARVAVLAAELLGQLPMGMAPGMAPGIAPGAVSGSVEQALLLDDPEPPRAWPVLAWRDAMLAAEHLPAPPLPTDPDALALLAYTSGTTGKPKACRHTHATLLASLSSSSAWKPVLRDSVVLAVAPLFHMLGLQNGMHLPLLQGATMVLMPRWNAAEAAQHIEQHRVTVWSAPPAMVIDLFAHPQTASRDLSSLRMLSGGGAAMPEAVTEMLKTRFGLVYQEAYGLTETASFLHANPPGRCKPQCLGVPTQQVDSRIIDPDTLQELPHHTVGELITSAPQVMLGYWRRPDADAQAFITLDGKRFFRTGDLAERDEDGYFFMRDRLKRMINVSGFKVWPAELESALYAHPAVHEACVIGVPDAKQGESVKALVVLRPEHVDELTPESMIQWCRERMAHYKAPRQLEFVSQLPKSSTGKIQWRELQEAHRTPN